MSDSEKMKLPGWAVDNRTAVLWEVRDYRRMSREQKAKILASLCRGGATQLSHRADRKRLLDYRDPLPESTRVALKRLRKLSQKR